MTATVILLSWVALSVIFGLIVGKFIRFGIGKMPKRDITQRRKLDKLLHFQIMNARLAVMANEDRDSLADHINKINQTLESISHGYTQNDITKIAEENRT